MGGSFWSEGTGFKTIVHIAKQGVKVKGNKNIRKEGFKHLELNEFFFKRNSGQYLPKVILKISVIFL